MQASLLESVVLTFLKSAILCAVPWLLGIWGIRTKNFRPSGSRVFPPLGQEGKIRSEEVQYHNNAIYRDFEFFYKITLAILGGTAYLVSTTKPQSVEIASFLLYAGAVLLLFTGILFSLFIFFHQWSKIERWEKPFTFWTPLSWQETWMVISMITISSVYLFNVTPQLVQLLNE